MPSLEIARAPLSQVEPSDGINLEHQQSLSATLQKITLPPMQQEPIDQGTKNSALSLAVTSSFINPYLACLIDISTIVFILVTLAVDIWVEKWNDLENSTRLFYTAGTTVLATLIRFFISKELKCLWLEHIQKFQGPKSQRQADTLLGIGKLKDSIWLWPISATALLVSLTTAALVAAVAPTSHLIVLPNKGWLNRFDYCLLIKNTSSVDPYMPSWMLPSGSHCHFEISKVQYLSGLPSADNYISYMTSLKGFDISPLPQYAIGNVAVMSSAIGGPVESSKSLGPYISKLDITLAFRYNYTSFRNLHSVTLCHPVFDHNPVQCKPSGHFTNIGNIFTVTAGNCTKSSTAFFPDPNYPVITAGVCPRNLSEGKSNVIFGTLNKWAEHLKLVTEARRVAKNYSVVCEVDIAPVIAYRWVTLAPNSLYSFRTSEEKALGGDSTVDYKYLVSGGELCTPTKDGVEIPPESIITPPILALGAFAIDQVLSNMPSKTFSMPAGNVLFLQAMEKLWWIPRHLNNDAQAPLLELTQKQRQSLFAFDNSRNALEDVLGLVTAIAVAALYGTGMSDAGGYDSPHHIDGGEFRIYGTRVGPGKWWTVVFIIPELYSLTFLIVFLWRRDKSKTWSKIREELMSSFSWLMSSFSWLVRGMCWLGSKAKQVVLKTGGLLRFRRRKTNARTREISLA